MANHFTNGLPKIQTGSTFPVPAYAGCPGKKVIKQVSICLSAIKNATSKLYN